MQPSLFDIEPAATTACEYPHLAPASAYRYGCRCHRCAEDKSRGRHPTSRCRADGCTTPRLKHRHYCATHAAAPNTGRPRSTGPCELCPYEHGWYESQVERLRPDLQDLYRRVCAACRHPAMLTVRRHHLDTYWAVRLLTAEVCEICAKPFARGTGGRLLRVIDHDHRCPHCAGSEASCGRCVRGVLCHTCNRDIAGYDALPIATIQAYLDRLTVV